MLFHSQLFVSHFIVLQLLLLLVLFVTGLLVDSHVGQNDVFEVGQGVELDHVLQDVHELVARHV